MKCEYKIKVTNYAISWKAPFCGTRQSFRRLTEHLRVGRLFKLAFHANFAVLRFIHANFVYIIFYGGHVNCTGVAHSKLIPVAVSLFEGVFCCHVTSHKIQAIAATSNTYRCFAQKDIDKLKNAVPRGNRIFCVRDYFTGILIRFEKGGSAQLFYSGKVNFLGAKSLQQLFHMWHVVRYTLLNVRDLSTSGAVPDNR